MKEDTCGKCLGSGFVYDGEDFVVCNFCVGKGKSTDEYKPQKEYEDSAGLE